MLAWFYKPTAYMYMYHHVVCKKRGYGVEQLILTPFSKFMPTDQGNMSSFNYGVLDSTTGEGSGSGV